MKIAVVGSGGREHAILWRLSRDPEHHELFALPGNGGTTKIAKNVKADIGNVRVLAAQIAGLSPDLVTVGPEVPLAAGLADLLHEMTIPCFGPSAKAARIESSKVFSKELMHRRAIPTANFEIFRDFSNLEHFVKSTPEEDGWVVKADGLAAGKGAYVCSSIEDVLRFSHDLLVDETLGEAGRTVVLERKLAGREVSALFWCDGETFAAMPAAQDYKRSEDGDCGQNTGGMGSCCPAAQLTPTLQKDVEQRVIAPILRAMREEGCPYQGILYAGLMLTKSGPQVIEFNCRFGDPETQVILPIWQGNLADTMLACAENRLKTIATPSTTPTGAAVCVVLAAKGYPDNYAKAIPLTDVADTAQAVTFHAGTMLTDDKLVSTSGRVLNAVGLGATVSEAREQAYGRAAELHVPGLRFRFDIARGILQES